MIINNGLDMTLEVDWIGNATVCEARKIAMTMFEVAVNTTN